MGPTVVYFDVDGVLNALQPGWNGARDPRPYNDGHAGWCGWERTEVMEYPITYAAEMVQAVNALAARPDVECRWLTTWNRNAGTKLAPALGLDGADWMVLGEDDYERWMSQPVKVWWKVTALLRQCAIEPGPSVWVDDDLWRHLNDDQRASLEAAGVHLVQTQATVGLKKKEYQQLLAHLDALATTTVS